MHQRSSLRIPTLSSSAVHFVYFVLIRGSFLVEVQEARSTKSHESIRNITKHNAETPVTHGKRREFPGKAGNAQRIHRELFYELRCTHSVTPFIVHSMNQHVTKTAIFRITVTGLLAFSFSLTSVSTQQASHTLTGDIRYHKSFHSRLLNNDRDVIVYLPPGYETFKNKRFSVLYLQDGQNLFDGATSFIPNQEWKVDETAQSLINSRKIEPLIIVGIYNTGKDRVNEYTPAQDSKYKAGGKAELYGRMLVEELKPFIDRTYRTRPDAEHTG